jgi:SPP1 family phage portal protein
MSDIKIALENILTKREGYQKAEAYYEGVNGEVFANQRWFKVFRYEGSDFRFNFSKTVVDSVLNRLEIKQILAGTEQAMTYIDEIWNQTDLKLDINEIHRNALVFGDSYAIVWPDETGTLAIDYNSPMSTTIIYSQDNPRQKEFAAKIWQVLDGNTKLIKLNMYYPDRIEKYMGYGDIDTITNNINQIHGEKFLYSTSAHINHSEDQNMLMHMVHRMQLTS